MTSLTTPMRASPPLSDYARDDRESDLQTETFRELADEYRKQQQDKPERKS